MKKTLLTTSLFVSSFFLTFAQVSSNVTGTSFAPILSLVALAQTVLNKLLPFTIGLATVAFFWFLVKFIWMANDNPDEQIKAKSGILWALLALFVMVAVWGIIGFIANLIGVQVGGTMSGFKLPGEL